ncbi:hypothetical protein BC781_101540 [Sediminitomix flava]|uniref:Uncharacterized protein n=1 Tax=Sediminitomix flava TaxID=379075 RepID=A0A315ZGE6_SEDFL|nr:hypothetical protein BC781_101540 [Sediminitomix flava]
MILMAGFKLEVDVAAKTSNMNSIISSMFFI